MHAVRSVWDVAMLMHWKKNCSVLHRVTKHSRVYVDKKIAIESWISSSRGQTSTYLIVDVYNGVDGDILQWCSKWENNRSKRQRPNNTLDDGDWPGHFWMPSKAVAMTAANNCGTETTIKLRLIEFNSWIDISTLLVFGLFLRSDFRMKSWGRKTCALFFAMSCHLSTSNSAKKHVWAFYGVRGWQTRTATLIQQSEWRFVFCCYFGFAIYTKKSH